MRNPSEQALKMAATLDQLARHFDLSDAELAQLTGLARTTVQQRRRGARAIKAEDIPAFAAAFGLPIEVLYMERTEAIRWVLENVVDGGMPARRPAALPVAAGGGLAPSDRETAPTIWKSVGAGTWHEARPQRDRHGLRAVPDLQAS